MNLLKDGWGIIAEKVMRDRGLSLQTRVVYAYIASFSEGESVVTIEKNQIAKELAIEVKSLQESLNQLQKRDYIGVEGDTYRLSECPEKIKEKLTRGLI